MAEISFDSQKLTEIIQQFEKNANSIKQIRDDIQLYIGDIKMNWTGSQDELVGRDNDFNNIILNLDKIKENFDAIANFLNEKEIDFKQINYK